MGKKKILLEQRYVSSKSLIADGSLSGRVSPSLAEPSGSLEGSTSGAGTSPKRAKSTKGMIVGDSIASTTHLEKALADMGVLGIVMNKIMESTLRYRPEKDAVILKAFQSKSIPYDSFRKYLYSAFWLAFDETEFESFASYFDPQGEKVINGYDFMIVFIKLFTMRKARESLEVREKQEAFLLQQKEEEERKKQEQEKKMDLTADFSYSDEVKARALQKLREAAFKFDPKHPASGSTEALDVDFLKPIVFK